MIIVEEMKKEDRRNDRNENGDCPKSIFFFWFSSFVFVLSLLCFVLFCFVDQLLTTISHGDFEASM